MVDSISKRYLKPPGDDASQDLKDFHSELSQVINYMQEQMILSTKQVNTETKTISSSAILNGKIIDFASVAGGANATASHGVTDPVGAIVIKNNAFNESTFMMVWELTSTTVTVRNGDPFALTHDIRVLVF